MPFGTTGGSKERVKMLWSNELMAPPPSAPIPDIPLEDLSCNGPCLWNRKGRWPPPKAASDRHSSGPRWHPSRSGSKGTGRSASTSAGPPVVPSLLWVTLDDGFLCIFCFKIIRVLPFFAGGNHCAGFFWGCFNMLVMDPTIYTATANPLSSSSTARS